MTEATRLQAADCYYRATPNRVLDCPVLREPIQADVCVIGGGFTGMNTALELASRGLSVVVLEAHQIGWGASGCNGGQLIRGVGQNLERFLPLLGQEGVRALQLMGFEAVARVRQRVEQYGISCDLSWGYCDVATRPQHWVNLQAEQEALQALGYGPALRLLERSALKDVVGSERYWGGLLDEGSGHLHPLNLLLGETEAALQHGVRVFEHSAATRIDYGAQIRVLTARGSVQASTLVLACNAHLGALHPELSRRILPAGSYLIATDPLPDALWQAILPQNTAVCDMRVVLDYFRLSADRRLIFGGACHYSGQTPKNIAAYMRPKMLRVFPQLASVNIAYHWGGMIGIGLNRLPQIGRLPEAPNVFYAQAYSGHGVNVTHLAAHLLAEAIVGQVSGRFDLFARVAHRPFPGGRYLRAPLLALGMLWYRLRELW